MTPQEFVGQMGWSVKRHGNQFNTSCPLCNKPGKFYMNIDHGAWDCKSCQENGSLYQIMERLGQAPKITRPAPAQSATVAITLKDWDYVNLGPGSDGMVYLKSRGLDGMAEMFKIKEIVRSGDKCLRLPYIRGDYVVFEKGRSITDKKNQWRSPAGAPSILFGLHLLDKEYPIAVLTEGEFDAMAGYAYGLKNVLSVPNGAGSFDSSWLNDLEFAEVIILAYDMDDAGENGAEMVADKLGKARCRRLHIPYKDLNECLMNGVPQAEILKLIENAKDTPPKNLKSALDVYEEMLKSTPEGAGKPSKFDGWNDTVRGVRQTEITVLVGDTGSGKSTYGINMVLDAMERGDHALIISSEMTPTRVMSKLACMIGKGDYLSFNDGDKQSVKMFLEDHPLFFLDVHGKVSELQMAEAVEYCATRFGVKYVLLDHLHFFIESQPEHERQALESYMRAIVAVKMKTGVHVLLICHPRATQKDGDKVGMASIKGASGIKQDADNVIALTRPQGKDKNNQPYPVQIQVYKNRYDGTLGMFKLDFAPNSQLYASHIGTHDAD